MKIPNGPSSSFLVQRLRTLNWIFRPFAVLEDLAKHYGDPFVVAKNVSPLVVYFSSPKQFNRFSLPIQNSLPLVAATSFYYRY